MNKSTASLPFVSAFQKFWQNFLSPMLKNSQLQVWKKSDRKGNVYWSAYDPMSGRSSAFGSEAEMRIWIEQRYYR